MRILIVQTAFLGDLILSTALMERLHQRFPQARLEVLVRKGNERIFEGHPYITSVIPWDKDGRKASSLISAIKTVRKHSYDLVVNLQRFFSSGLVTGLSKGGDKRGFDKNPFSFAFSKRVPHRIGNGSHEVERNHALIRDLCGSLPGKPRLYPGSADVDSTAPYREEKYVCLAPASVWFTKQWPKDKWVHLASAIEKEQKVYLLGGPGDRAYCQEILNAVEAKGKGVRNLAGAVSPLGSAVLIRDADLTVTNDSAPVHLASAMDAPVAVIYCSTVPEFGFGPLSTRSYVIQVEEKLACRPCGIHGHRACPQGHFKCARDIAPEKVLSVLKEQASP